MTCWQFRQRNPDILFFMVTPVNKPSSLQGTLSRFLIFRKNCPQRIPSLLNRFVDQPLLPRELPLPLHHFHQYDTDLPLPVIHTGEPVKDNKSTGLPMNRASAEVNGNSGRSGTIRSEILPFSVERERLTESFRISLVNCIFRTIRSEFCQKTFRNAIVFKTPGDDIFERDF